MTDAAGFADFSFILDTWYIVLTGAFSKSEYKLQPRQRRTDSDLTDHRRSLTASFVKFLTLMSRLSLLYSASSALQCKSKYPWINVTRSEMRRKMTENEGHVSWRNQKLHEFYKSKASKCCQDLTSKYKNLFQVWDFRLYIKTLQFRYFGEKTVSGPIDFHSIFCSCYGSQWLNHLVTNFKISPFVFHTRKKVIGTTWSQSLTSKYKNLITVGFFCSTISKCSISIHLNWIAQH